MTSPELIDAFITWITINRGRAIGTGQKYRKALELLLEFLAGRELLKATDDDLVLFTGQWLHRRGVAARARRPYVAGVRGFYKFAMATRRATHNPAAALSYPSIGRPLPMVLSLENYEKLMSAPDLNTFEGVRDAAMLAILGGCGTKEAELQLRVYMEHEALREVDRAITGGDQVLFITTRNRRCAPHLYRGERRRFSRQSVNAMLLRYGEQQKIARGELHPHALRHLFGTELAEEDIAFDIRQDLLGHVDPKSTALYTHLAMRKKVQAIDQGGPLAKIRTAASDLLRSMRSAAPTKKPT